MELKIPCDYCFLPIEQDWYGWGYFSDEYGEFYFHSECFQEANNTIAE